MSGSLLLYVVLYFLPFRFSASKRCELLFSNAHFVAQANFIDVSRCATSCFETAAGNSAEASVRMMASCVLDRILN